MKYQKFFHFLQNVGKDPSALFFEDELTRLKNRRYLLSYFRNEINWQVLESPVSVLLIDIDHFKRLNEQYGNEAADQALVHVSGILKEMTTSHGLAVRYAGDEFIILLPDTPKEVALQTAETLLKKIHYNLFFSVEADTAIPLTVSIGIATAPDDAISGKNLIHQADTALYDAKQSGRNRYVDIATVIPEAVSYKTALHYLDNAGIVGRKSQFEVIANALKQLSRGEHGFLIIDGAPGMGKTSFIDLVQRNLEKKNVNLIRIGGALQESYRPYYLIAYVAMAIMNQRADKGQSLLDDLDEITISRLAHVIPQLVDAEEAPPEDDAAHREAIFRDFCSFFAALLDNRPMVLLIDDFDYSDPASLHLLHAVLNKQLAPILICGTATTELTSKPQAVPLELFRNAYSDELGIQNITLTELTAEDISKYVNMIFPGIKMARRTIQEIATTTEGNPLFIGEILRKMVDDRKIYQEGYRWRIGAIEKKYFPRSLEDIIQQKMAMLDEESREFIDRASAFGESTSLSMLAGFSKEHSAKIYDYLNEAVARGIVRSDFNEADENIRFSSKRIRDTIYDDISPESRTKLNEQIGSYKEALYNRHLLPSKAIAAHHYSHCADSEKARAYAESIDEYHRRIFNAEEMQSFSAVEISEAGKLETPGEAIAATPLSKNAVKHVPNLLRALIVAIRNTRLYPPQSKSVRDSMHQLFQLIQQILRTDERLSIISEKNVLLINQVPVDNTPHPPVAEKILELWHRLELKHLTFIRGISEAELTTLINKISRTDTKSINPGFWADFQTKYPMPHIIAGQITYQKVESAGVKETEAAPRTPPVSRITLQEPGENDATLTAPELKTIQQIISSLLAAINKLKLYPIDGPVAKEAIQNLHAVLTPFLDKYPDLTIARVDNALLVNGLKIDTSGFEALAGGLIKFMAEAGLSSLTILNAVSPDELARFIAAAGQCMDNTAWREQAEMRRLTNIRFNEGIYDIKDLFPSDPDQDDGDLDGGGESKEQKSDTRAGKTLLAADWDMDSLPGRLRDMFLTGDFENARAVLERLRENYKTADESGKQSILDLFDAIINPDDWKPSAAFLKFVITPLMDLLKTETAPERLNQAAGLCYQAAEAFIMFGEYSLAAWVFTNIQKHPDCERIKAPDLPAAVFEALIQGLGMPDPKLQQSAFELLSSMGEPVRPYLINMIKQDENLHTRRLAAELIKHQGEAGVAAIKRSFLGEHFAEDRARILDVIDVITTDIQSELSYALSDANQVVRRAGGRLAERLDSPAVIDMLIELAQQAPPETQAAAINLLGRLNALNAADTMIHILDQSDHEEVLTAVCRAMGQIGDPSFILPLQNILRSKRRLFFKKARPFNVRVAAAYAISQIDDPRSPEILKALVKDSDPRVREAARNLTD